MKIYLLIAAPDFSWNHFPTLLLVSSDRSLVGDEKLRLKLKGYQRLKICEVEVDKPVCIDLQ